MRKFDTMVTEITLKPSGMDLWEADEYVTTVKAVDEGGGMFIEISQDGTEARAIRVDPDEWTYIAKAVHAIFETIEKYESQSKSI